MAQYGKLSRLIYFFTIRPKKYLTKKWQTPKYSLFQFGAGGYFLYYIANLARNDAIAFEKVRQHVQKVAEKGSQMSIEVEHNDYHQSPLKKILVILNPASAGGDSGKYFSSIIEPILDVSGFDVHYHKTTGIKNARDLAETILPDKFSALIIVGGDGTTSEVLTGLMRRDDKEELLRSLPIGIIPTGKSNQTYKQLVKNCSGLDFNLANSDERADFIISETSRILSALSSNTKDPDSQKIPQKCSKESLLEIKMVRKSDTPEDVETRRPTYALNSLEWGLKKEIPEQRSKYWFIVPFKTHVARGKLANDKIFRNVDCEIQFDKETEKVVQQLDSSRSSLMAKSLSSKLITQEVDTINLTKNFKAENFEIKIRPEDRKKLILVPKENLGSSFDFAMSEDFLREFNGSRPNFHRIKLKNFENAERIFVDGNDYELDEVDSIEVRLVKDQFFMIQ